MKRGINTLDALFAILILLFLITFLQNYTTISLNAANDFGGEAQAKSLAVSLGSQMNSFYSINPGAKDYLDTSKSPLLARIFGQNPTTTITKAKNDAKASVKVSVGKDYPNDYPVAKDISYSDSRVTK